MSSTFRMGWVLALAVVPLTVFAADERTCNMRDAALPTNSITYVLCEQGLLLVTNDEGATWAQRKIASRIRPARSGIPRRQPRVGCRRWRYHPGNR